jgi:hypothetical protein
MRALTVIALIVGAFLRFAILSIGVPSVDSPWRTWSYHAATRGPWNLYGPRGATVRFAGFDEPVVYPPLALDELALIGRAHLLRTSGRFENDVALTRTIKGAIVLLDGVMAALLFAAVRRIAGAERGWWAAIGYWLNPAVVLATTLGFVDVLAAIPAVGALIAASAGREWIAGALLAAAVLTKPQGVFVAPVVALALWNAGLPGDGAGAKRLRGAIAAGALTTAIITAPVIAAGHAYDMVRSVAVLAGHNALSALAFNLWWLVGYVLQAAPAHGFGEARRLRPEVLTHAQAMARGFPNPRVIGIAVMGAAILWGLTRAIRARDLATQAAVAAFTVVAYFTLSVQVHENHFFLAIPLLAVAAALRRELAPVFAALSVAFALNLYLIYGLRGAGPAEWTTTIGAVDSTVVLAVVVCALFGWLVTIVARLPRARPTT